MENSLKVKSFDELVDKAQKMRTFQIVHNELKKDFTSIYEIALQNSDDLNNQSPLIRACVKELFSLIEADLYLLNAFNPYPNYHDKTSFTEKLKKTFKQHATIFDKAGLQYAFKSKYFKDLLNLKFIRDRTTHPKGKESLIVTSEDLKLVNRFYLIYTKFIGAMMENVFVSVQLPLSL